MIRRIQQHLEAIYDFETGHSAEDFLVGPETARRLGGSLRAPEEVLVGETDGDLELALYLEPKLLDRLEPYRDASGRAVVNEALPSLCQVAEGVSHLLYLVRAAHLSRKVSMLELETQAEIDKFAVCVLLSWGDGVRQWANELFRRIFEAVRFREDLSAEEHHRYEEANRLSGNFCRKLLRHTEEGRFDRLLSDLRYAYRLGAEAKLRHLAVS